MRPNLHRRLRLVALTLAASAAPLTAQARLAADAEVRSSPTGNVVATLRRNTSWTVNGAEGAWTSLRIQGWVEASRFAGARDSFPEHIGGNNTLRIREEPSLNGQILGEFEAGAGVNVLERRGNWARIRREVWVRSSSIAPATATTRPTARTSAPADRTPPAATPPAGAQPSEPQSASSELQPPSGSGALKADSHASMRSAPGGTLLGELAPGAIVEARGRERGWVKVRIEAWVAESLFVPADTAFGATLSAADLRLDPEGMKGRVVRWEVQVVALQIADPLRRDLERDEPFLLAMGPTGEDAILYIAVPPSLLAQARTIPAMERVLLTARVRTGKSAPTGAPVLDLLSIIRR